jgi:Na+-transporting NADH:ubiquinone oxidoreductase subunit C
VRNSVYTLVFATVVGLISAAILTGVGLFAAPYRLANEKAEKVRHVMQVLGVPYEGLSTEELLKKYSEDVREDRKGDLDVFIYGAQGQGSPKAVAIAFAGPGLWGPIEGFISLEPDMRTIHGVTFYKQEETPGLGGEIGAQWFQQQFVGKSIIGPDGKPGMRLLGGGKASADNEVDAISGATLTSDKVQTMLNGVIADIVKEYGIDGH